MPTGQRLAVVRRRTSGSLRGISSVTGDDALRASRRRFRGYPAAMLTKALSSWGLRGWHLHGASFATIWLCVTLWIRAKTVDQEERGNAERRALFVGLWPPMFWLIGDSLQRDEERSRATPWPRRLARAGPGMGRPWNTRST